MKAQWLKLSVDILTHHKIRKILRLPGGSDIFRCWIAVLTLAMKSRMPGFIIISENVPATSEDIAIEADVANETAAVALKAFVSLGMCKMSEGVIEVKNFREYQSLDRIEYLREKERIKKQRQRLNYREKSRQLSNSVPQGHGEGQVGGTPRGNNTGEGEEKEKRKRDKERSGAIAPREHKQRVASAAETAYLERYTKRTGSAPHEPLTGRDCIGLNAMHKRHPDTFVVALDTFFEDAFAASTAFSPGLFQKQFNRWVAGNKVPAVRGRMEVHTPEENMAAARRFLEAHPEVRRQEVAHDAKN